jgi:MFS family permease
VTSVVRRVLLGNALSAIGSGLTMPLLIVYLGQVRDLGTTTAGLVVASMAVVQLALLPMVGALVDRFGPRPVLMAGLVVEATGVALLTTVTSVALAFAVAAVVAAGGAFVWSPQSALLGRLTDPEQRQRVFGIQFMLLNLGIGIGGIVAAVVVDVTQPQTFATLYLFDALTYLFYLAVLLTLRGIGVGPAPRGEDEPDGGGYREVLSDRRMLRIMGLGLVLLTCGYGSLEVGLPTVITVVNGLDVSWVAVAFAVNTFSIVALQMVVLRLIQGRSRSRLIAVVAVLWAVSWLLLGLTSLVPTVVAVIGVCLSTLVFAVGETLWAPIVPSLVNDLAPDRLRGRYNSMQSLVWGVSGALGPALTGLLLGAGLVAGWVVLVVGGCLVAAWLSLRLRSHLTPTLDGTAIGSGTMRP